MGIDALHLPNASGDAVANETATEQTRALDEVLDKYPDINVIRAVPWGNIRVYKRLPAGRERVVLVTLTKEEEKQVLYDVHLAAYITDPKTDTPDTEHNYTHLHLRPQKDGSATVLTVETEQSDLPPDELISQSQQGLEIFEALLHVDTSHELLRRTRYTPRVSDSFGQNTRPAPADISPALLLRQVGEHSQPSFSPEYGYKYMMNVLALPHLNPNPTLAP
ncbi:hypothetical protein MUP32_05190 [Candidatus Microgenomates bacterium]|nr:hypothetical protein [Candidatus Microgenomates bacterium]